MGLANLLMSAAQNQTPSRLDHTAGARAVVGLVVAGLVLFVRRTPARGATKVEPDVGRRRASRSRTSS